MTRAETDGTKKGGRLAHERSLGIAQQQNSRKVMVLAKIATLLQTKLWDCFYQKTVYHKLEYLDFGIQVRIT
jgi:hypothetical protein